MVRKISMIIALLVASHCMGQHLSAYVIGAAGGTLKSDGILLSICAGQAGFAGSLEAGPLMLNVGFLQTLLEQSTRITYTDKNISILVYPNPLSDYFTLSVLSTKDLRVDCQLHDYLGRIILRLDTRNFVQSFEKTFSSLTLSNGIYQLEVTLANHQGLVNRYFIPLLCINQNL